MRTKRNLTVESLERREVFTGMPGVEGFDIYDAPVQINGSQGSGTLIGPSTFAAQHHSNDDGSPVASPLGLINGNGDDYSYDAGLISSPLGLSQSQSCHEARDRLLAMVASDESPFDQIRVGVSDDDGLTDEEQILATGSGLGPFDQPSISKAGTVANERS